MKKDSKVFFTERGENVVNIEISFNSFQAKHLFPAKQKHYLKSELAVFEKWPILTNTRWNATHYILPSSEYLHSTQQSRIKWWELDKQSLWYIDCFPKTTNILYKNYENLSNLTQPKPVSSFEQQKGSSFKRIILPYFSKRRLDFFSLSFANLFPF